MKKVLFSLLIVLVCFIYFSCANFLKGSDIKKNIEDEIAISTAPTITVRLGSETGTGTFPSVRDISVKVGFKFSVEFILNSADYKFNKWTFTDAKDTSRNLEEYVKYETTISENVYTLDISILKQIDNLLIKPDCILIPKAVKQLPEMIEEGKPQDSTIVVVFNTPVKAEDFDGTFKNISIKSGGVEIAEEYFNLPVLSSDKKNLSIIPVGSKKLIENVTENGTRDITVTLKTGKIVDSNGNVVREPLLNENGDCPFYNDISWTWTYRVNQNQDGEAPVIHSVSLFADAEEKRGISDVYYEDWGKKRDADGKHDFDRHRVKELFVKVNGSDVGGGVRCIKVSETLLINQSGTNVSLEPEIAYYSEGDFENDVLYPLSFRNLEDGLIKLDFSLLDYAENESDILSFFVIKDTKYEASIFRAILKNDELINDTDFPELRTSVYKMYREADENGIDTLEIDCLDNIKKYFTYSGVKCESYPEVTIEISYDGINYNSETVIAKENCQFEVRREAAKTTFVKISFEDEIGNKNSIIRIVPKTISIVEKPEIKYDSQVKRHCFIFKATDLQQLENMLNTAGALYGDFAFVYKKESPDLDGPVYTNDTGLEIGSSSSTDPSVLFRFAKDNTDGNTEKPTVCLKKDIKYYFYAYYYYRYDLSYSPQGYWNGCLGKPYELQIDYSYNSSTKRFDYEILTSSYSVKESACPVDFYVKASPAIRNAGTRSFFVTFNPSDFVPDPECDYYLEYTDVAASKTYYTEGLKFELPSGSDYDFFLIVKDKNGNIYKSDPSRPKRVNAKEDNKSPSVNAITASFNGNIFERSHIRLSGSQRILDSESGLYKENNIIPFTYFVVKNERNQASELVLSQEELHAKYTPKYAYFDPIAEKSNGKESDGIFMDFWFDEKEDGYYTVFIEAKDDSALGNTSLTHFLANLTTLKKKLVPEFSYDSSKNIVINISKTIEENSTGTYDIPTFYLAGLRESDNNWIRDQGATPKSTTWTINSDYKDSFLKASGRFNGLYDVVYYSTVNFDPLNPVTCENKNLMKCETGYQVFADSGKPVFIHTMVSQYNYGTNKQDWYNKAIETNLKLKKNGGSFSYHPDFSHYPEDYWMTVIVHFADDDAVMSYPMQIKDYR